MTPRNDSEALRRALRSFLRRILPFDLCPLTFDLRLRRLLRSEAGATTFEYVVVAVVLVFAAILAYRMLTGILIPYLHRVYLVVTLPIP